MTKQQRDLHTRGKRLLELFHLVRILDGKSVKVATASDLELGLVVGLLDGHSYSNRRIRITKEQ